MLFMVSYAINWRANFNSAIFMHYKKFNYKWFFQKKLNIRNITSKICRNPLVPISHSNSFMRLEFVNSTAINTINPKEKKGKERKRKEKKGKEKKSVMCRYLLLKLKLYSKTIHKFLLNMTSPSPHFLILLRVPGFLL